MDKLPTWAGIVPCDFSQPPELPEPVFKGQRWRMYWRKTEWTAMGAKVSILVCYCRARGQVVTLEYGIEYAALLRDRKSLVKDAMRKADAFFEEYFRHHMAKDKIASRKRELYPFVLPEP